MKIYVWLLASALLSTISACNDDDKTASVTVPNVVGQSRAAAMSAITGAGLTVGSISQAASPSVASGDVVSETPAAGANVAGASSVDLVVSTGRGTLAVPNVAGDTQAQATSAITAAGLILGPVTQAASTTVASGNTVSENPAAGSSVTAGSAVALVISSGPAMVAVPNVVDDTQAQATTAITNAGLTLGTLTTASSANVASGSIISQSPPAGASVPNGSPVTLVVSSGPAAPAASSCLRIVRNLLGGNTGNWGQAGAPVIFADGATAASYTGVTSAAFTLQGSTAGYSLLGTELYFAQNTTYSLRLTVSNFTGNYPGSNFEILGAPAASFSGVTHLAFQGDGVYALVFTYLGQDDSYLARVGINVDAGASSATGPGGFTVSDVSLEQLSSSSASPSEFVTSGYAWGFNYPSMNSYDSSTGLLSEAAGPPCANNYRNVWAVTADSFGDNTYSFTNQLANNLAENYVFYVDSVPGRPLATAQANIDPLLSNSAVVQTDALLPSTALPSTVAKPNGLIVEGGVDDIVEDSSAAQLETVAASIISDVESKGLEAIFMTVSPFQNNANWTSAREQVRITYNQWLLSQASAQNGIYVYDMAAAATAGGLADDSEPAVLSASFDSGDGLHPNLAGGQQIAQQLKQILDAQLSETMASKARVSRERTSTVGR